MRRSTRRSPKVEPSRPSATQRFRALGNCTLAAAVGFACFLAAGLVMAQSTTLRVPASSFHSDRYSVGSHYDQAGFVYGIESPLAGTTGCLVAPLHLPVGAEIIEMSAHLWNNQPFDFGVRLYRKRIGTGTAAEELGRVSTNVSGPFVLEFKDISIVDPVVDDLYSYYLATASCPDGPEQRIYAVDVEYLESALIFSDGFESGGTSAWNSGSRNGGVRGGLETLRLSGMHFRTKSPLFHPWHTDVAEGAFTMAMQNHSNPDGVLCMAAAPVVLPDGAQIEGMISYLWDTSTNHNAVLRLRKGNFATTAGPQLVLTTSTSIVGAPPQWQIASDLSADFGAVDNASSWFYLEFCQGGSTVGVAEQTLRVQTVDILYSMP